MAFRRDALQASAASTRSSASPATTSTSAGGCRSAAGRSASAPRRWSGITGATPSAPTGAAGRLRPGRGATRAEVAGRSTTPPATSLGGRVYGNGFLRSLRTARVYHGSWGSAPFQSLYTPSAGTLGSLPAMPEWYLALTALTALSALAPLWAPLLAALPLLAVMVLVSIAYVVPSVRGPRFRSRSAVGRSSQRVLTALLCLAQPAVRLSGRLSRGPDSLAPSRADELPGSANPLVGRVVRGMDRARGAALAARAGVAPGGASGRARRAFRPLGPRGTGGDPRRSAAQDGGRGSRLGDPVRAHRGCARGGRRARSRSS